MCHHRESNSGPIGCETRKKSSVQTTELRAHYFKFNLLRLIGVPYSSVGTPRKKKKRERSKERKVYTRSPSGPSNFFFLFQHLAKHNFLTNKQKQNPRNSSLFRKKNPVHNKKAKETQRISLSCFFSPHQNQRGYDYLFFFCS